MNQTLENEKINFVQSKALVKAMTCLFRNYNEDEVKFVFKHIKEEEIGEDFIQAMQSFNQFYIKARKKDLFNFSDASLYECADRIYKPENYI